MALRNHTSPDAPCPGPLLGLSASKLRDICYVGNISATGRKTDVAGRIASKAFGVLATHDAEVLSGVKYFTDFAADDHFDAIGGQGAPHWYGQAKDLRATFSGRGQIFASDNAWMTNGIMICWLVARVRQVKPHLAQDGCISVRALLESGDGAGEGARGPAGMGSPCMAAREVGSRCAA